MIKKELFENNGNYQLLVEKLDELIVSIAKNLGYRVSKSSKRGWNNSVIYNINKISIAELDLRDKNLILIPGRKSTSSYIKTQFNQLGGGVINTLVSELALDFSNIQEENLQIMIGEQNLLISDLINETIVNRMEWWRKNMTTSIDEILKRKIDQYGELAVREHGIVEPNRVDYLMNQVLVAAIDLGPTPHLLLKPGEQYIKKMEATYELESKMKKKLDEVSISFGEIDSSLIINYSYFDQVEGEDDIFIESILVKNLIDLSIQLTLGLKDSVEIEGYHY